MLAVGPVSVAWVAVGPDRDRARDFVAGRSLVTALVGGLCPDAADWSVGTGRCPRCGERHGAVELAGVPAVAGVSYARGLVVAAAARTESVRRLGVDVERDAADTTRTSDLERLLGRSRQPILRRWTQIEAVLKADGRGLLVDPGDVRVRRHRASIADDPARYRTEDVPGPAGYVISLAWCDAESSAGSSGPAKG